MAAVALVAMAFAFVDCKQSAGGGAPDVPQNIVSRSVYTFNDEDGNKIGSVSLGDTVAFSEIKGKVASINSYENQDGFKGWKVNGEGECVSDDATFSDSTTFQIDIQFVVGLKYTFKDGDAVVGSKILSGEKTFDEIRTATSNVAEHEQYEGFLGWKVDGEGDIVEGSVKFGSTTVFVAAFENTAGLVGNTYTFKGTDGQIIGSIKLPGTVDFARVKNLAIPSSFDASKLQGWKEESSGVMVLDETQTFSGGATFIAVEVSKGYREHISIDDLVKYSWYDSKTQTYIVFANDMGAEGAAPLSAYVITGKKYTAATAIIEEWVALTDSTDTFVDSDGVTKPKFTATGGKTPEYEEAYKTARDNFGYGFAMPCDENGDMLMNSETYEPDYSNAQYISLQVQDPVPYMLILAINEAGDALIDIATGEKVFGAV